MQTFTTGQEDAINGTSLQGSIRVSFSTLTRIFGEPSDYGDDYKTDANWYLKFKDGTVATIYNWKDGKNYCGEEGSELIHITDWHIGGETPHAVELVQEVLDQS